MIKAKKLPSGNWRARIWFTDEAGAEKSKSFTAPTKKQAELAAAEWRENRKEEMASGAVQDLVRKYIETKAAVLSPSTVRAYKGILKTHIEGCAVGAQNIEHLRSAQVQAWISGLVDKKKSPKTIKNAYGLLTATIELFSPGTKLRVKLPDQKRAEPVTPTEADIERVLDVFRKRNDTEMIKAIYLAACCSLRRGEICGLYSAQIDRKRRLIRVVDNLVTDGVSWRLKGPKTASSVRSVPVPEKVLALLPEDGRVVDLTPAALTDRWMRAVRAAGGPVFRFHDLRHYFATVLAYNPDIPKQVAKEIGGWSASSSTMERVYIGTIEAEKQKHMDSVAAFFDGKFEKTTTKTTTK